MTEALDEKKIVLPDPQKRIERVEENKKKTQASLDAFEGSAVSLMKSDYEKDQAELTKAHRHESIFEIMYDIF